MSGRRWLVAAALAVAFLQIGFLAWMIAGRAAVLRHGREVTLAVEPVDPRDLLRGDHVVLGYNISRVPAGLFQAGLFPAEEAAASSGEERTVHVRLKRGADGVWQPVAAGFGVPPAPAAADDEVDIRGTARVPHGGDAFVAVAYGIERFYVPEGEGRAIEAKLDRRAFRMKVAVARDGTAQIKSFHDGETMLYAEPLY